MNTTSPTEFPPPIVNDAYLPASTGEVDRSGIETGTRLNLVTGEYRIAELIRGVLYDTDRSTLVASVTEVERPWPGVLESERGSGGGAAQDGSQTR